MKRSAIARISLADTTPESALIQAFGDAWRTFRENHGRIPDLDSLNISGGFCTTSLVLEITEDPWDD